MQEKLKIYLKFAIKENAVVIIKTKNQKSLYVEILDFNQEMIEYAFEKSGIEGKIRNENVKDIQFKNKKDAEKFYYQLLGKIYRTPNLKEHIENFKNYYLEIIDLLLSREKEESIGYYSLTAKKNVYPKIFEKLYGEPHNLLYFYFTKNKPSAKQENFPEERLLIQQANGSQKRAIEHAIEDRISIIEGPPGTGKTTTIINILANFVYQNKKTLIVSKNNSAIDNIVEELEKMELPQFFIRLRKPNYYAKTGRAYAKRKVRKLQESNKQYRICRLSSTSRKYKTDYKGNQSKRRKVKFFNREKE